jgi:hypothetical protein
MGWGRYFLLGDLGQQLDLADQKDSVDRMRNDLARAREVAAYSMQEIRSLSAENDQLKLYLAAIIRLLVTKGVVSSQEISDLVEIVDAEDGTADGGFTGTLG